MDERRRREGQGAVGAGGGGYGRGYPPPAESGVCGGGCAPSGLPRKIFNFLNKNGVF